MIIKIAVAIFLGKWLLNIIRHWRRERAAERDWAKRIVHRGQTYIPVQVGKRWAMCDAARAWHEEQSRLDAIDRHQR